MMSLDLSDIAIWKIKNADFCEISKSEAITLMQNIDLSEKSGTRKFIKSKYPKQLLNLQIYFKF